MDLLSLASTKPPPRRPAEEAAQEALAALEARWDARFPMISRKWRANWANLSPFFAYPPEIRKVMYTTKAIEALNAQLRKVTKKRGSFPDAPSGVGRGFAMGTWISHRQLAGGPAVGTRARNTGT